MRAAELIERASWLIADADHGRVSQELWLRFLSDAQRQLALLRPDATARRAVVPLLPGTLQAIPDDGLRLMDVIRLLQADGTPGRNLAQVDRAALDAADPSWHAAAPATPQCFAHDPRAPRLFYVSPPCPADPALSVELLYSAAPAELADENAKLAVDDIYAGPLLDYALHLALAVDSDSEASRARGAAHLDAFRSAVQAKLSADLAVTPSPAGGRA